MDLYDLWFYNVKISNRAKRTLFFELESGEERYEFLTKNREFLIKNPFNKEKIKKLREEIESKGINIITIKDDNFPVSIKEFDYLPMALYYKGNIKALNKEENVSIVGSRNESLYGRDTAKIIVKYLCDNSINIVSGLANGIDRIAHETAIKNKGFTCAVIGCGIDIFYPASNKNLQRIIEREGCVISQFPMGTAPYAYNFPERNKLISALSKTIIVVEAKEKSGSLITATHGASQGKDVISVPGSIFNENSKGTNKLISDGAIPLLSLDTLKEYISVKNDKSIKNKLNLSRFEREIIEKITDVPVHLDDIIKDTSIDIVEIYNVLFEMQRKNLIYSLSGNYYVKRYS